MNKKTMFMKKLTSLGLATVMLLSMATTGGTVYAADSYDLAVHYDMSAANGYLTDLSGNGNDAKLYNMPDSAFTDEYGDAVLNLPGTNGSYAELPLSIVGDLDNYKSAFSIEMTFIPHTAQFQFLWTIGTGYQTDYLFMNPRLGDGKLNVAIKSQGQNNTENSIPGALNTTLSTSEYSLVTVTSSGNTLKLYVNGSEVGTLNHAHNLEELFRGNGNNILGYIAKSNWDDPYCDATVTDFKIYNETLTAAEVKDIYENSEVFASELIKEDIASVDLGNTSAVGADLELPSKGSVNGSSITWKSSNTAVITNAGKVTLPKETTTVELTATFTKGGTSLEKVFAVSVIGSEDKCDVIMEQMLFLPYYLSKQDVLPTTLLGEEVVWESDCSDIDVETGVITPSTSGVTDVQLTAAIEIDGTDYEKTFDVKLLGTDSAYVIGYTRETTNQNGMYEALVTQSMHLGYSEDGEDYEALLNNTGVLFAEAQGATTKLIDDPYIFRMADGSFGVLASRIESNGSVGSDKGKLLFFTSEDLLSYEEVGMVTLSTSDTVTNAACVYDSESELYRITWTSAESGLSYANTTSSFKKISSKEVSIPLEVKTADTNIPYAIEGNVIAVAGNEGQRLLDKLGDVINTTVEVPEIVVEPGETVDIKDIKAVAHYSDGSSAEKIVMWNSRDIKAVDFDTPGTYTVEGTIRQISDQTNNNKPFLASRADPTITEYNGKYYFISTTEDTSGIGLYIRESDTVTGINKAPQHLIFDIPKSEAYNMYAPGCHWAPELHVLDGELYVFFSLDLGGTFNVQSVQMRLVGDDPTDYNDWGELVRFQDQNGNPLNTSYGGITLDMTYFSYDDRHYVAWAQRNFDVNGGTSDLWIGEIDLDCPYRLISEAVKFVDCSYGWERNHTFVIEGPNTIFTDDTLYLTYSGGATDETYCVGMTQIALDSDTDFLDVDAWQKTNYPILTGLSVDGYWGPGHNAYVYDEDGTLINVYHARIERTGGYRDAFLRIVHFGADGEPILDLEESREILPKNKDVTLTIKVQEKVELPYEDVAETDWFYDAVLYNYVEKTMTGLDETHFGPYGNLSRAQFALMLYRIEGKPKVNTTKTFGDITGDEWYGPAVLWAAENGIVTGYLGGSFGPVDLITREQMAVMMYRYANYLKMDTSRKADFDSFKDAEKVSPFAVDAMGWATGSGIITGKESGTILDPQGNTARSEAAVIIQRFMK